MMQSSRLGHMVYEKNDKNGVIVLGIFEEKRVPPLLFRGARDSPPHLPSRSFVQDSQPWRATALDAALRRL